MEKFFNPLFIFWLFIATFFAFKKAGLKKASRILGITALVSFALCTLTPLPDILVYSLENRYNVLYPKDNGKEYYIYVLDGGHSSTASLPVSQLLNNSSLVRITEGIRLHRILRDSKLVCSGDISNNDITKTPVKTGTAIMMGARKQDVISAVKSGDTYNEALNFKKRFGVNKNILLVTSAIHMPRAVKIFKKQGLTVTAAPTDFYIKEKNGKINFSFMPGPSKLRNMQNAIHEYAGIFYYTYIK